MKKECFHPKKDFKSAYMNKKVSAQIRILNPPKLKKNASAQNKDFKSPPKFFLKCFCPNKDFISAQTNKNVSVHMKDFFCSNENNVGLM